DLVDLIVHARCITGRGVEVLATGHGRTKLTDPLTPGVDLGAGVAPTGLGQRLLQEHAGVGGPTQTGSEDTTDRGSPDTDVDETPLSAVDVDLSGVSVGEARADGQHQVRLQERGVAVALGGLYPGHARVQG